jgi:hypothetical protein
MQMTLSQYDYRLWYTKTLYPHTCHWLSKAPFETILRDPHPLRKSIASDLAIKQTLPCPAA